METKTLNMIVIHKQSKWSKFKRRLSGWFSTNDKICSDSVIPEIIVTSPDDLGQSRSKIKLFGFLRASVRTNIAMFDHNLCSINRLNSLLRLQIMFLILRHVFVDVFSYMLSLLTFQTFRSTFSSPN